MEEKDFYVAPCASHERCGHVGKYATDAAIHPLSVEKKLVEFIRNASADGTRFHQSLCDGDAVLDGHIQDETDEGEGREAE